MLVLALLVGACVFAAMTGPAVSLRTRTQALSQTLAAASPTTKTVQVDAPWDQFTAAISSGSYFGGVQGASLTPSQFAKTQQEIGQGLARVPVPLGAGAWAGMTSRLLPVVAGAGPLTFTGQPPQMEFVYRNTLAANAQLVAGSYAHGALPGGALAGTVTTQMAARFGLHPGSRVVLTIPTGPVRVVITAIVRIRGANSSFWAKDSTVGLPDLIIPPPGDKSTCYCWVGAIFADPDQLVAMPAGVSFEDAASLPVAYGTAHRMLITHGTVKAGEKVLVLGASGGVGTGCVLLAKMLGAEVKRSMQQGKERIDLKLGGANIFIAPIGDGENVNAAPKIPYRGLDHFGLAVSGIDEIAAGLKAKGVEFTKEPTTVRPGVRICFIKAPEGVSIELLDRDPRHQ